MAYMIKTYTFSTAVPQSNNTPFVGKTNFDFTEAQEGVLYLDDTDNRFEQATVMSEPGQQLLKDTELGGVTLPEGTVLTFIPSRVGTLLDSETGYGYYVFYPHAGSTSTSSAMEMGDRTTVLIIPMPGAPEFDPTHIYSYRTAQKPTAMDVDETAIPPSYLSSICFAAGTLIETANGPRPVEDLRPGDLVLTRDRGLRPLCWVGMRRVSARLLDIAPNLRPIRVQAGALGPEMPARDLVVSPQHRVLVKSRIAERIAGTEETLVAAKHLCGMPGISVHPAPDGINYHHLLFDRHEIVLSNGCWTESLYTGPQALLSLGPAGRREIRALFPQLFAASNAAPKPGARVFLSGSEARELTRRHLKNDRPLVV